ETSTRSLHAALPIWDRAQACRSEAVRRHRCEKLGTARRPDARRAPEGVAHRQLVPGGRIEGYLGSWLTFSLPALRSAFSGWPAIDRKSTRLNSSHSQ